MKLTIPIAVALAALGVQDAAATPPELTAYAIDAWASGVAETLNNIANVTVVSKDTNDLRAEYRAGFVQGRLQAKGIVAARDNTWDLAYLTETSHGFPKQPGPTPAELLRAAGVLESNYTAFIAYLKSPDTDPTIAHNLKRLLFRMVGIYHGATQKEPAALDFSGAWLPDAAYFKPAELGLGYETVSLTFMDLYYINSAIITWTLAIFGGSRRYLKAIRSIRSLSMASRYTSVVSRLSPVAPLWSHGGGA
jgi:hypothetical protein